MTKAEALLDQSQRDPSMMDREMEIVCGPQEARITFSHLVLDGQTQASPAVEIVVEKEPTSMRHGERYGDVLFGDFETEDTKRLAEQAAALRDLPEQERPRRVLEILRDHMNYSYPDVVDRLEEQNPALGAWVREYAGTDRGPSVPAIPLFQLIQNRHGVCTHLAPAYLWLAEQAGLEGAIFTSDQGVITNVAKPDTGERLFKSVDIGQPTSAHAWVEVKLSDGSWIPVDPSTELVGDDQKGLDTFAAAGYRSHASYQMDLAASPASEVAARGLTPVFAAGESQAVSTAQLQLRSSLPRLNISRSAAKPSPETAPQALTSYSGPAGLHITARDAARVSQGNFGLRIVDVRTA